MKNFAIAITLMLLTGCQSDNGGGCRPKNMTKSQADGVVLSLIASQLNSEQTNWTVTVTPRTNAP